jgi:hypothetical protein
MSRIYDEVMAALAKTRKHYKIQYDKKASGCSKL